MDDDPAAARAPVNIVCVVDTSGSMKYERKLKLVCETLKFIVGQMKATDTLGIVSFSDKVRANLDLTRMDKTGANAALCAIESMRPGGRTNLSGGLLEGLSLLRKFRGVGSESTGSGSSGTGWWPFGNDSAKGVQTRANETGVGQTSVDAVLLLTDGRANGGIRDTAGIVRAMKNMLDSLPSVCTVNTFGYGIDHDAAMLEAIAEAGHGSYNFVETADKVADAFGSAVGGLMSVTAQQIKLTVAPPHNMGIEIANVETTYEKKHLGNGMWEISMGDLYSEEERDVLVIFNKVPSVEMETAEYPLLAAQVEYVDVIAGIPRSADAACMVRRTADVPADRQCSQRVETQVHRMETALLLRTAGEAAMSGRERAARKMIRDQITKLKRAPRSSFSPVVSRLVSELEAMDLEFKSSSTGSMLLAAGTSHARQRSSTGSTRMADGGAYLTQRTRTMKIHCSPK